MVGLSLIEPQRFLTLATLVNDWILERFSKAFAFGGFIFLLTCIWAAFSPLGKIRIGGEEAKALLSKWNWIAVTLTTTIAIGIIFWATAEPIYHLYNPGGLEIKSGSDQAVLFSMSSLFMHWSFTPYAIYTVPGLTFALVYYNLQKPFSLSSPISVLTGKAVPRIGAELLDGLALLCLLFGLSASLGSGILSISGGIARLTPLSTGPLMSGTVAIVIIAGFYVSSASGLQKGIKILSDINTKIFLALLLFVFLAGPTFDIIKRGGQSIVHFGAEFLPRSMLLAPFNNEDWVNAWTVFYFANWMAWAPLAALFLGRIARGYTVRAYIVVNLLLPSLFSIVWMILFGGLTLTIAADNPGLLNTVLQNAGPEHVLTIGGFTRGAVRHHFLFILRHSGGLQHGCHCLIMCEGAR